MDIAVANDAGSCETENADILPKIAYQLRTDDAVGIDACIIRRAVGM